LEAAASTTARPELSAPPRISASTAEALLFLDKTPAAAASCRSSGPDDQQIRCMLQVRFARDAKARDLALTLYDEAGSVAGIERPYTMNGGWRGMIDLVPEPPLGAKRQQLAWVVQASKEHNAFFSKLIAAGNGNKPRYRWQPIELKFFRSVGRTTPSAYASGWAIAWNVNGSLHTSAKAVRETMFHEAFHLNDRAHGGWSHAALSPLYDKIVTSCTKGKLSTTCLKPFAPNSTKVRGGTYYAFQPGNGVSEYAAELAVRYYQEHRRVLAGSPLDGRAFKCGPDPNHEAWRLLIDEFFGGIDLVAPCTA